MELNYVSPGFFSALSIPLVRGRDFTAAEAGSDAHVIIVPEATARRLFPGQDALGKQLKNWRGDTYEVIGVAKDAQIANLGKTSEHYVFFPAGPKRQLDVKSLLVRTSVPAVNLVTSIKAAASTLDPEMKIDVAPLQQNITQWAVPARISVVLASTLGLLGLLLSAIGIYGTSAYSVARRVREIGIRMALGAQAADMKALVLRQAMRPVFIGAMVGVVLCAAVSRLFTFLLFGISPVDPLAFTSIPVFLLAVAAAASYIPARRAVRVDPILALRHE
jgi:ABC-type antimicrobial peptide transport system permease subunit